MQQPQGSARATPQPVEQPAILGAIDRIEKSLSAALAQADRLDHGVDRIKAEPSASSGDFSTPPPNVVRPTATVETRLRDLDELATRLSSALGNTAERLDRAV